MKAIYPLCLLVIAALPAAAQFTEIKSSLPKPPFPCAVWGDYDGDGDVMCWWRARAGRTPRSGIVLISLQRASAAWGDFDNDGDLDLAMTGETSNSGVATLVYRNNDGVITSVPGSFTGVYAGNVGWADSDRGRRSRLTRHGCD